MHTEIFIQTLDEFNYTSSPNFFEKSEDSSILCLPGFEILFYNFNKIIVSNTQHTPGILTSSDVQEKEKLFYLLSEEAKQYSTNLKSTHHITTDQTGGKLIYDFVFNNLAMELETKNAELYLPKKKDYEFVKEKLKNVSKKIVTINGRNLGPERDFGRNNSFFDLINFLISNNFFVVNCTLPSPIFSHIFDKDSYLEILEDELYDYSRNVAYFLNSNCLVSVSNSGGITNHICTKTNLIIFGSGNYQDNQRWVDNPKYGFNNKSLFEISKKIKPTHMTQDFEIIKDVINSLDKPSDIKFFDENKIVNYEI